LAFDAPTFRWVMLVAMASAAFPKKAPPPPMKESGPPPPVATRVGRVNPRSVRSNAKQPENFLPRTLSIPPGEELGGYLTFLETEVYRPRELSYIDDRARHSLSFRRATKDS
jgi:hypothetical protein